MRVACLRCHAAASPTPSHVSRPPTRTPYDGEICSPSEKIVSFPPAVQMVRLAYILSILFRVYARVERTSPRRLSERHCFLQKLAGQHGRSLQMNRTPSVVHIVTASQTESEAALSTLPFVNTHREYQPFPLHHGCVQAQGAYYDSASAATSP